MVGIYAFDDFEFDSGKLELTRAGRPTPANTLQLRLLSALMQSPGQMVTKRELLDSVWDGRVVSDNVVTVAIARLRKMLDHRAGERDVVVNVHGRGYRFVREVTRRDPALLADGSMALPLARPVGDPLVGRDAILNDLRLALNDAGSGSGGVILISGEAGIGKTRLVEAFAREASGLGVVVGWGSCREIGDTPPLWPIAELLRAVIRRADLDLSEPRLAGISAQLVRLLPELASETGSAADGGKHLIFDAVVRTFALAAEKAPCLLVLDDLQRADPASLELLGYLTDDIRRSRLLLVAALRSAAAPLSDALSRVLGHRNALRIALPRLSEAQVASYVEAVLGDSGSALQRAVYRTCEGNPFFMTELTRQLRLSEERDPACVAVPDAALDLVRERLNRLDDRTREVLSCAALIGRSFRLPILQAVSGSDAATLMLSLDVALGAAIIQRKTQLLTEFVFGHELLRAVLYEALGPAERRERHLRAAQALELRADFEAVAPADLAYHSRAALPLGDLRKTIRYCVDAGSAAANVFAHADGARHFAEALETLEMLNSPSPRLRIKLLLHQALLSRAQSTQLFQPMIARVVQLAREQRQAGLLALAAILHDPYLGLPPLPGALGAFRDALALLEEQLTERPLRAALLAHLAASPPLAFDDAASGAQLALAERIAESSPEPIDHYSVRAARLYLSGGPAQRESSRSRIGELQDLSREHATLFRVPALMLELHRALTALQDGDLSGMHAALERGKARSLELDSELLWQFERFEVIARINAGDVADTGCALRALHQQARRRSILASELFCAYDSALLLGSSADHERLRDVLAPAEHDRPNIWSLKLRALQATGHYSAALAALQRVAPADLAALPSDRDYLGTLGALARAVVELGARDYAEALYDLLLPYVGRFAAHVTFVCEGAVSQLLGMLDALLGRRREAEAHLRAAIDESAQVGLRACEQSARRELESGSRLRTSDYRSPS